MGQLQFDKIINLTTLESNPDPKYVDKSMIGNETNNDIYQYYLSDVYLRDKKSHLVLADYDALVWDKPTSSITAKPCRNFGIKTFPGVGAVGFYTPIVGTSRVLIPIHLKEKVKYPACTLAMEESGDDLIFIITPPEDVSYACYRILMADDKNAFEYITYVNTVTLPKPDVNGTYTIYCIGYVDEGSYISEDSNMFTITITGKADILKPKRPAYASKEYVDQLFNQLKPYLDDYNAMLELL